MALRVGAAFGPYEVHPLEGRGGMAEVYRAHDTRLDREVVLKVLSEDRALDATAAARLTREARLLASLNHPNIATIYGIEEHGGVQALVLELVEGPTLADRIAQGPVPIADVLRIGRQIAAALEAAHEHGIVHRDVKPSNIKLRPDGTVKVLDFGLARAVTPSTRTDGDATTLTASLDELAGTSGYMSPEQAQGLPVDKRTDIWAFGCVLYEMLTGQRAFGGGNVARTLVAVLHDEPDWERLPDEVPSWARAVLRRCLEKDPALRMRDIGDVRLALDGAFEPDTGVSPGAAGAHGRRTRALALAVALAVAAGIGAALAGAGWLTTNSVASPLTFELRAPAGSRFRQTTMSPWPALSPDGRRLAFIAESRAQSPDVWTIRSRYSLWIQTIGDLEASPVAGTADAERPFWSPDGESVAFFADGRLRKVSLTGDRLVQTLSDVPARLGGAWIDNETILFSGLDGLYRVGSAGGEAVRVTTLDESKGEFAHRWPAVVPGSPTRFTYLVCSTQEAARGIHLGSLTDERLKRRLVPDESNGAFVAAQDGGLHFVYVRDAAVVAQAFDRHEGRLTGDPVLVARPVAPGESGRFAPFAVAGSTFVHRPVAPSPNRLIWFDRRGLRGETIGDASTEHRYPALSPDEASLAVSEVDAATGRIDIWITDLRRHTRERLTREPAGALYPVWMPDSRGLVYASARGGVFDLYGQPAGATGSGRPLYQSTLPVLKYPTDVTSDGRSVMLHDDNRLWRLLIAGGVSLEPLPPGIEGRVSPDGRWLAYTSHDGATPEVYITDFPQAAERWRVSTGGGESPQWRRDSAELFYVARREILTAVPVERGRRFQIGTPRALFRARFPQQMNGPLYAPSADGQRFLVLEVEGDREVLLRVTTNWALPRPTSKR